MDNAEYIFGDYLASEMQLRELAENIIRRDSDYCANMLKLFKNQKLERLRAHDEERRRQEEIINNKIEKDIE